VRVTGEEKEDMGWQQACSFDFRWARVVAAPRCGEYVLAVIDTNGDGREHELEIYLRGPDGWSSVDGQDDVDPGPGPHAGRGMEVAWIYGLDRAGHRVEIEYVGDRFQATAGPDGWWAFVGAASRDRLREQPRVWPYGAGHRR
jgi:hypothetical protein